MCAKVAQAGKAVPESSFPGHGFKEQKILEYDTEHTNHLTESSGQENVSSKDIRDQESLKLAHERIDGLSREISQLRTEHQTAITRLQAEHRTAIVQLHAGYQASMAQLQGKPG